MSSNPKFAVAGSRGWNRRHFESLRETLGEEVVFVRNEEELCGAVESCSLEKIFFLHWSSFVPDSITKEIECICFHMTDVPFGRGGSPLQNLIVRGKRETQLTALRMVSELDAGPVYLKRSLSLAGGTAEEIYLRAGHLSCEMVLEIIRGKMEPKEQEGEVVTFERRRPEQSVVPEQGELLSVHDHIRMLDADGYPRAFFERGGFRYEFSHSCLFDGKVEGRVKITKLES